MQDRLSATLIACAMAALVHDAGLYAAAHSSDRPQPPHRLLVPRTQHVAGGQLRGIRMGTEVAVSRLAELHRRLIQEH